MVLKDTENEPLLIYERRETNCFASLLITGVLILMTGILLISMSYIKDFHIPILIGSITSFTGVGIISLALVLHFIYFTPSAWEGSCCS